MNSRRLFPFHLKTIALLLLMFSASGCLSFHRASQSNSAPAGKSSPETSPATTRPDNMDAAAASPADLLAQQAESYSQKMAPAIARRSAVTTGTPAVPAAPAQPSLVQWGETGDTHLSLLPGYLLRPNSQQPVPAAVEASPSSANPPDGQLAAMKSGPISNAGGIVSAEVPTHDQSPPATPDRAKTQIASITPTTPTETMQDNSSDAQTGSGESFNATASKMAKRVNDYPHDVSAQLDYQLLQFLMDEPVPNLQTISALPDEDREMMLAVMDGLSNYRNNLRADNNMLLSKKVRPLLEMADRLRSLADLTIPTLALCREVRGFGNYEPWDGDPPHFSAGKDHPVILYCEVQNFSSQLGDNRMWQTSLVQDAVLYTEGGMSAWSDKTQAVNDSARNRRQDLFIVQRMVLPGTLPMGRYLLKVTIEDKQSHHVAEATQPLLIIAE